jgi:hypothetical protein
MTDDASRNLREFSQTSLTARLLLTHLRLQSLKQLLAQHSVGLRILLLYSAHPGKEPVDTNFARSRNVAFERRVKRPFRRRRRRRRGSPSDWDPLGYSETCNAGQNR